MLPIRFRKNRRRNATSQLQSIKRRRANDFGGSGSRKKLASLLRGGAVEAENQPALRWHMMDTRRFCWPFHPYPTAENVTQFMHKLALYFGMLLDTRVEDDDWDGHLNERYRKYIARKKAACIAVIADLVLAGMPDPQRNFFALLNFFSLLRIENMTENTVIFTDKRHPLKMKLGFGEAVLASLPRFYQLSMGHVYVGDVTEKPWGVTTIPFDTMFYNFDVRGRDIFVTINLDPEDAENVVTVKITWLGPYRQIHLPPHEPVVWAELPGVNTTEYIKARKQSDPVEPRYPASIFEHLRNAKNGNQHRTRFTPETLQEIQTKADQVLAEVQQNMGNLTKTAVYKKLDQNMGYFRVYNYTGRSTVYLPQKSGSTVVIRGNQETLLSASDCVLGVGEVHFDYLRRVLEIKPWMITAEVSFDSINVFINTGDVGLGYVWLVVDWVGPITPNCDLATYLFTMGYRTEVDRNIIHTQYPELALLNVEWPGEAIEEADDE